MADNDTKEKKIKECADDGESKITHQNRRANSKSKIKGEASADSSKVSEVQKTDYIHVRARRGQATDSHSLAERVIKNEIKCSPYKTAASMAHAIPPHVNNGP